MGVRWGVIGDVVVAIDGEDRHPSGARPCAVLALLLIRRNRVISVDSLIDAIWPDEPPPTARNSIQRFVSDLRSLLGESRGRLVTDATGYRLEVSDGEFDLAVLETEIQAARSSVADRAPTVAFEQLRSLAARLETDMFPGVTGVAGVDQERRRLSALRVAVIDEAVTLALDSGLPVLDVVERWAVQQPENERLTAQLMELLARVGRTTDALAVFQRTSDVLRDEFGVSPSPALAKVELDILQQELTMQEVPATVAARPRRTSPALIGREVLSAEVSRRLHASPFVTLVGPGGVGKTSLALHLADEFSSPAGPRAPVVLLTDVDTPDLMVETVSAAIGMDPLQTRTLEELGPAMMQRAAAQDAGLLVLDNAEHLIADVALLVEAALADATIPILVTSREPLGIAGEHVVTVESLPTEPDGNEVAPAIQLFAERGAAASGHSVAELIDEPATVEICRMLDGMPLAIELAAVQLRVFPARELAQHLERSLAILVQPRRNDRHASLRSVVEWSWQMLDEDEQRFLALLAPFRGFSSEAAAHLDPVHGVRLLSQLVTKSLIQADVSTGDRSRFTLLVSVRAFAAEQAANLGIAEEAGRLHADIVLAGVRRWTMADSIGASSAHDHVELELYNTLSALDWLAEHGCVRDAVELMTRAGGLFAHRGPIAEGRARFARTKRRLDAGWCCPVHDVVHADPTDRDARGAFLTAMSSMGSASGNMDYMFGCGFEATSIAGGDEPFDWAVDTLATMAIASRSLDLGAPTLPLLEKAERLAPLTESAASNTAYAATWRGVWAMMERRYEEAISAYGRALDSDARPGRNLLLPECGWLVSLHLLGRHDAAREVANSVRSRADTDAWHHVIDVVRAIALAPTAPSEAARIIEGLIEAAPLSDFPGRQHDVNLAVGVVAFWAGRPEETIRLLARTLGRTPAMNSVLVEYHDGQPGLTMSEAEWAVRWNHVLESRVSLQEAGEGWMRPNSGTKADPGRLLGQILRTI